MTDMPTFRASERTLRMPAREDERERQRRAISTQLLAGLMANSHLYLSSPQELAGRALAAADALIARLSERAES